jgi:hypothetical protein
VKEGDHGNGEGEEESELGSDSSRSAGVVSGRAGEEIMYKASWIPPIYRQTVRHYLYDVLFKDRLDLLNQVLEDDLNWKK